MNKVDFLKMMRIEVNFINKKGIAKISNFNIYKRSAEITVEEKFLKKEKCRYCWDGSCDNCDGYRYKTISSKETYNIGYGYYNFEDKINELIEPFRKELNKYKSIFYKKDVINFANKFKKAYCGKHRK